MKTVGELAQKLLAVLHIPPEMHFFVVLGLACFVSIAVGFLAGLKMRAKMGRRGSTPSGKSLEVDSRIRDLNRRIRDLVDQNGLLNRFMMDVPHIIRRLNATISRSELAAAIVKLAGDTLHTGTVYLYVFHQDRDCLERIHAAGATSAAGDVCALGEGIVGCAAKDLTIKSAGSNKDYVGFGTDFDRAGYSATRDSELAMAAPIHSEKRLIGVLGIGHSLSPTGGEKSLLGLVADIAAVTMANRAFLRAARKEATTDPLTGLFNRRYFSEKAREYAERAILEESSISIFLFDIDNFKNYNDQNGHDAGDILLKDLSNFIQGNTRKTNVVARYGGEEFIVMLPDTSKEDAYIYADRLRELLAEFPFPHKEKQPLGMVSISGGIACFPRDGRSIQEVTRLADAALYRAKAGGRNRIELHDPFLFSASGAKEEDSFPTVSAEPEQTVNDAVGIDVSLAAGNHTATPAVTDAESATGTDGVAGTVNPNLLLTADAGPDHTVTDTDADGSETVTLDGTGSTDPYGVIAAYEWKEGATVLGTTSVVTCGFAVGLHTITLTVTDSEGVTDTGTVLVTVNAALPSGPTVRVPDIDVALFKKGPKHNAKGRVSIVDDAGAPVQGVAVTGEWKLNGVVLRQASKATNKKGVAQLDSGKVSAQSGDTLTITVISVSKEGYTYDPTGNVETSDGAMVP